MKILLFIVCYFSLNVVICQKINTSDIYRLQHKAVVGNETIDLSLDMKKPMILDFGAINCPPCLVSLAKLDSLKMYFKSEIQMYMVMKDPLDKVLVAKRHNSILKNTNTPIIVADTLLNQTFEHMTVPHIVWIGKNGRYLGATDQYALSISTVEEFLKSEEISSIKKNDKKFDYGKGLENIMNLNVEYSYKFPYRSFLITSAIDGLLPWYNSLIDTMKGTMRYAAYNYSILGMYTTLLNKRMGINFFPNQLILDGISLSQLLPPHDKKEKADWEKRNTYCFEFEFPWMIDMKEAYVSKVMQSLDNYFDFKVDTVQEKVNCWVIRLDTKFKRDLSKYGNGQYFIRSLLIKLNNELGHPIVLDETTTLTNNNYKINFEEGVHKMSFDDLKEFLALQGYILEVQERIVEKISIKKN